MVHADGHWHFVEYSDVSSCQSHKNMKERAHEYNYIKQYSGRLIKQNQKHLMWQIGYGPTRTMHSLASLVFTAYHMKKPFYWAPKSCATPSFVPKNIYHSWRIVFKTQLRGFMSLLRCIFTILANFRARKSLKMPQRSLPLWLPLHPPALWSHPLNKDENPILGTAMELHTIAVYYWPNQETNFCGCSHNIILHVSKFGDEIKVHDKSAFISNRTKFRDIIHYLEWLCWF